MRKTRKPLAQAASVSSRLRELRKEHGLTQSDLAGRIGVQQSDLSRIEKGEYRVSLDNLFKILSVFGMDVASFFADSRPAPKPMTAEPLSHDDMQILHMLRQLNREAREEVREFIEFKVRRQRPLTRQTVGLPTAVNGSN